MKDLTPEVFAEIADHITCAKNLIELNPHDLPALNYAEVQAAQRVFDLLLDAEAIMFAYFEHKGKKND